MTTQAFLVLSIWLSVACAALASPKYETNGGSKVYPPEGGQWRRAVPAAAPYAAYGNENKTQTYEQDAASTKDRLQRLGYSTGYGSLNSYPGSTGLSAYNPIKLDLGGVVLGTLVGIGAIIIIPKILSAFHGGYGGVSGYGRSEADGELPAVANMLNKIDDLLGQNNIDSTSCMQRAVCSYVRSTEYNMKLGTTDQMDELVHMLSENSLVDYLLDGTAIKEALEHGKTVNGKACEELYAACPLDSKTATNVLMKLLPKKSANSNSASSNNANNNNASNNNNSNNNNTPQ